MNKIISIITDWDSALGSGHIQRMSGLLAFLNHQEGVRAYIVNSRKPAFLSDEESVFFIDSIYPGTDLIIRDMRNSSQEEIKILQAQSRVIVIDDNGAGRDSADFRLDLLPNPLKKEFNPDYRPDLFLYGYNFINGVFESLASHFDRIYDFAVYPLPGHEDRLISYLPVNSRIVLLLPEGPVLIKGGHGTVLQGTSHAKIIMSAKTVVSHFGIIFYEADLAGCRLVAVNPTRYHSDLTDLACTDLDIMNLGVIQDFDQETAMEKFNGFFVSSYSGNADPDYMMSRIEKNQRMFFDYLMHIISS